MLDKLLITGAGGGIATLIRDRLAAVARTIRLSDISRPADLASDADLAPDADFVAADLAAADAVDRIVAGCDGVLHLGGISTEASFARILDANIVGIHNLYEAARRHGRPRIFMASSNHVTGFYRQDEWIDGSAPHKPDSWYGVSKSFGEATALMYYHKFGQETAMVRIGSCFPQPADHRMLSTWMAPEDFISLVERVFLVPRLGCPVIYGVSDNASVWWDNAGARYLGWRPRYSSAPFAATLAATRPVPDKDDPVAVYQGGTFCADGIHED